MQEQFPNLRQLRSFEAVARLCSISAAAKEQCLSQPAITSSIHGLESSLQVKLFERVAKGTYPSEAGRLLQSRVVRLKSFLIDTIRNVATCGPGDTIDIYRRLSSSQLQVMVVALEQGLSSTARALEISQYSVDRSIRELERSLGLGVQLRDASGSMLAPQGFEFARGIKVALKEYSFAIDELQTPGASAEQRLAVGSHSFSKNQVFPAVLEALATKYPMARVEIREGTYNSLLSDLRCGIIDIVIGALRGPLAGNDVVEEYLFAEPYSLVVGPSHPLLHDPSITLEKLLEFEWVLPRGRSPRRAYCDALFSSLGREPTINIETNDYVLMRSLLQNRNRISILSPSQMEGDRGGGAVYPLKFKAPSAASRVTGTITRRSWLPTAMHLNFMASLRATFPSSAAQ